ncbi:DUF6779 domain-containing protein [Williamsia muralis]|uniref:DUF6779 domain-containing protein n=1 Tax=Williamsia marianensis TaxID=85044 RepID=UPI000DE7B7AE|nr:DUF6779 domain-containing protein [Williamsia marianensis]PVY28980.1 hypothetical protein C7458_107189 [Williamsia marianensis]
MTTSAGRSADARRARRGPGQWLLGVLLLFALGSSIFMIFTSEMSIAASLAVITALWAAVIGAILVTKYRRQADSADAKARDLRLVYELQLEREISARRQYELGVETQVRKEIGEQSGEELSALKAELQSLRSSLEQLLGELPDERIALVRERLPELENRANRHEGSGNPYTPAGFADQHFPPAPLVPDDGTVAERDFASTAPPAGRRRDDNPNESTQVIPVVSDEDPVPVEPAETPADDATDAEESSDAGEQDAVTSDHPDDTTNAQTPSGRHAGSRRRTADAAPEVAGAEDVARTAEPQVAGAHEKRAEEGDGASEAQVESSAPGPFVDETPTDEWEVAVPAEGGIPNALLADDDEQAADHPGAHASGRSVSELLTRFESSAPAGGRRRRRS